MASHNPAKRALQPTEPANRKKGKKDAPDLNPFFSLPQQARPNSMIIDPLLLNASDDDLLAAIQNAGAIGSLSGHSGSDYDIMVPHRNNKTVILPAPPVMSAPKPVPELPAPGPSGNHTRSQTHFDTSPDGIKSLLSSKWLPLSELKRLSEEHGFTYKKGRFTEEEDRAINDIIERYKRDKNLSEEGLLDLIFAKREKRLAASLDAPLDNSSFWTEVARELGDRPVLAVYNHIRRIRNTNHAKGSWTEAEDSALRQAYIQYGNHWQEISAVVGRMAGDCRDRWRQRFAIELESKPAFAPHDAVRASVSKGTWSDAEIEALKKAVAQHAQNWVAVSKMMTNRNPSQCREKWINITKKVERARLLQEKKDRENDTDKDHDALSWKKSYRANLVHAVARQNVTDSKDINFDEFDDLLLNSFEKNRLRKYWTSLTKEAKAHGKVKTHQEQVQWLLEKYPEIGGTYKSKRVFSNPERAKSERGPYKSHETISSDEE